MSIYTPKMLLVCALIVAATEISFSQNNSDSLFTEEVGKEIVDLMEEGDIPGLSLVIIKGNKQLVRSFGYVNKATEAPVTPRTLFELGSCTKAFTSLAVMILVENKQLNLSDPVSKYIPWLNLRYKGRTSKVEIGHLLHHTSGIPWNTLSRIPQSNDVNALEQTIKAINGIELDTLPGQVFEYATINYDVLALVVQTVVKQPFETYLKENVIDRLLLSHTTFGVPYDEKLKAQGYKIGFFNAREYDAPVYRGNNAAGYLISDAVDVAKWLEFQLGLTESELYRTALLTHQRDETVPLHGTSSYAMGWEVSLDGKGEIRHGGLNPNYTSYMAFRSKENLAVAVLANSNSNYTEIIGDNIIKRLSGEPISRKFDPADKNDRAFSIISFLVACYLLTVLVFMARMIWGIYQARRKFEGLSREKARKAVTGFLCMLPFLAGIYILPEAIAGFTWESVIVWTPISFPVCIGLIVASFVCTYPAFIIGVYFPVKNKIESIAPGVVLLSVLSGLANMTIIILITTSIDSDVGVKYLLFFYGLAAAVYLLGRRYVQVRLTKVSRDLTYDFRIKLIEKIFSTSFQKFEKIDRGKVYTVLNDDVSMIGDTSNTLIMFITSFITASGAFLYLATIAFWATILTILLVTSIVVLYYTVSQRANVHFNDARNARDDFMRMVNGMIDGFKELSLRTKKKLEFRSDIVQSADLYRNKVTAAGIRFVNAAIVGESLLVFLLAGVVFLMPRLFAGIPNYTIMSFVIVLLYLIAPINGMLGAVPGLIQFRIAWIRVTQFLDEIPANLELETNSTHNVQKVESIQASGIVFRYQNKTDDQAFVVGPIDLEVKAGEILFIVGGNGSGKTTMAKILTGLYKPDEGEVKINGRVVHGDSLSENYSAVFSPCYLFERLYGINADEKSEKLLWYLKLLDLDQKVKIEAGKYSTTELSGGQRKRLALLQCYLEDLPIYLFDEWAADQDPEYRGFFYYKLLPEMKAAGKIVIVVTHDDHFFNVADKILKMNQGIIENYSVKHTNEQPVAADLS
jgi:putative pyoverdin transport system ATP-binding/permease protein